VIAIASLLASTVPHYQHYQQLAKNKIQHKFQQLKQVLIKQGPEEKPVLAKLSLAEKKLVASLNRPQLLLDLFFIALPVLVRSSQMLLPRYHLDEYISAHISAQYNLLTDNFFGAFPQDKVQWVCQFPSPYFFLQKIFFLIFGSNLLTVKLSTLPYALLTAIILFFVLKQLFARRTAHLGLLLYSFLAISLYLDSWGLHFAASTSCYLWLVWSMLRQLQPALQGQKVQTGARSMRLGLLTAACYFFYASSYIALPIAISFYFVLSLVKKQVMFKELLIMLLSFALVASPFVTYMIKEQNFYLTQRVDQVNLLTGSWSDSAQSLNQALDTTKKHLVKSAKSLVIDDIGGAGGYDFNHQALFDEFTAALLIVGLVTFLIFYQQKLIAIFIIAQLGILFIGGTVLTIPPPAYHRIGLMFPLLIIVMSGGFYFLNSNRLQAWLGHWQLSIGQYVLNQKQVTVLSKVISGMLILFFVYANLQAYYQAIKPEVKNQKIPELAQLVRQKSQNRKIYVASFPGYAFEKFYYFASHGQPGNITTDYHKDLLENFSTQERYLYVVAMPKTFIKRFEEKDPQGKVIPHSEEHYVFVGK
jgi:hypothetical protein